MDNAQGLAEAYKDVVNEDPIRIGVELHRPLLNAIEQS